MKNKDELENGKYHVERVRDSFLNGVVHFVYLLLPVAMAFAGYFLSSVLWKLFFKDLEICPQWFKFVISMFLFFVAAAVVFVKTRNTNPVYRIRVSK